MFRVGRPKLIARVRWKQLVEVSVKKILTHTSVRTSHVLEEVGYMRSEWTLFKTSVKRKA